MMNRRNANDLICYKIYRSRLDSVVGNPGLFGGIVRSTAQSEALKGLAFALESGKQVLEEAYQKHTQQNSPTRR